MLYIHQYRICSPQYSLLDEEVRVSEQNILRAVEPKIEGVPLSLVRRMGKAVRLGVGVSLPLIQEHGHDLKGIIVGTANGGMEDCIKFLNQVIEFEEGTLTPTNFVQSTPNAIAAQLSFLGQNNEYNITHVSRGWAFENALLDAWMLSKEQSTSKFLLGSVEEISNYNHNIEMLSGLFKKEVINSKALYKHNQSKGTIAGEGATMFVVSGTQELACMAVVSIDMLLTQSLNEFSDFFKQWLIQNELFEIDFIVSGECGDVRTQPYFEEVENQLPHASVFHYKHVTGEYPTSSSAALVVANEILNEASIPSHLVKRSQGKKTQIGLIYNNYRGEQHSFILVKKAL
jgi:hypothetical protein